MDVLKALGLVAKVAPKRSKTPMLRGVLAGIDAGVLSLEATDCDHAMSVCCPIPGASNVAPRIVDPAVLATAIKANPQGDVGATLRAIPEICEARDWWVEPVLTATGSVTLLASEWRNMLRSVGTAMSGEETRYYLRGIRIGPDNNAVATDGHRMAVLRLPEGAAALSEEVILPWFAVERLQQVLAKVSALTPVPLDLCESNAMGTWVRMLTTGMRYISRVVDGTFPEYARVLPKPSTSTLTLPVKTLAGHAASLAGLYPRYAEKAALAISSTSFDAKPDYGAQTTMSLPVVSATSSGDLEKVTPIGFQPKFLAALKDVFPADSQVTLGMTSKLDPVLFTCDDAPDMRYVIMPIRL